jgi:hypothetical protein
VYPVARGTEWRDYLVAWLWLHDTLSCRPLASPPSVLHGLVGYSAWPTECPSLHARWLRWGIITGYSIVDKQAMALYIRWSISQGCSPDRHPAYVRTYKGGLCLRRAPPGYIGLTASAPLART